MAMQVDVIDAFTQHHFSGNPAAVTVVEQWPDETLMQAIASEINLSETVYVMPLGGERFAIRWFSPLKEIDFCGHATLAASFVLFERYAHLEQIIFEHPDTGALPVRRAGSLFEMSFPRRAPEPVSSVPAALYQGLSLRPDEVLRSQQAYFAIYHDERAVREVQALDKVLATLDPYDVVVSAPAGNYDFVSRYFWPASGGHEDPVTGSIHAGLVPFWAERLGKTSLRAYQASQRGGELFGELKGDRVLIRGAAVRFSAATLSL